MQAALKVFWDENIFQDFIKTRYEHRSIVDLDSTTSSGIRCRHCCRLSICVFNRSNKSEKSQNEQLWLSWKKRKTVFKVWFFCCRNDENLVWNYTQPTWTLTQVIYSFPWSLLAKGMSWSGERRWSGGWVWDRDEVEVGWNVTERKALLVFPVRLSKLLISDAVRLEQA